VPGIISVKPKIPCSPGLWPVMIELQETEETAGIEERIGLKIPSLRKELRKGITP